ncbi:hypothetical protein EDC01DRAFT_634545 [Geopyxis carbonaria]|nr:hypothetical protein EDC01DRAFT_634545 [Geopyxis carbonaria]
MATDGRPTPTADFCWEGRLGCVVGLLTLLYIFTGLRLKALRGITYSAFSPRGISGICIVAVTVLCTIYTCVMIWNFSVWYNIRGLYEQASSEQNDELLDVLRSLVPKYRKKVSFTLRMLLVTVLWLVKLSFAVIYYEFSAQLPRHTRIFLNASTIVLGMTYMGIWIATAADFRNAMERESYSPAAGAGLTLFTPLNTWAEYDHWSYTGDPAVSSLLTTELIITILNIVTDLLMLGLIFTIFRHLNLARGRTQFRAARLLTALCATTIVVALARLGIILSKMTEINTRLAFDTLTDFEAFIAGCAGCIPAMRVLVRDGRATFGFPASWGSLARSKTGSSGLSGGGSSRGGRTDTGDGDWTYVSDVEQRRDSRYTRPGRMMWDATLVGPDADDSACVKALSPVGRVQAPRGRSAEGKGGAPVFEEVSWTELAERGIR